MHGNYIWFEHVGFLEVWPMRAIHRCDIFNGNDLRYNLGASGYGHGSIASQKEDVT